MLYSRPTVNQRDDYDYDYDDDVDWLMNCQSIDYEINVN